MYADRGWLRGPTPPDLPTVMDLYPDCAFILTLTVSLLGWVTGAVEYISVHLDSQSPEVVRHFSLYKTCPEVLHTTLYVQNEDIPLRLVRNDHIHTDVPVYTGPGGNITKWKSKKRLKSDPCFYHDLAFNAALTVRRRWQSCELTGTLQTAKGTFAVTPLSVTQRRLRRALGYHRSHDHRIHLLSSQGLSNSPTEHARKKRDASTAYYVQVVVVADYAIYRRWYDSSRKSTSAARKEDALSNIKYYFSHVLNEVALRYTRITGTDFTISIVLSGFYIATDRTEATWVEQRKVENPTGDRDLAESQEVLDAFESWIKQYSRELPEMDHAMLFTGVDLYSVVDGKINRDRIGSAVIGGVCKYTKGSVNEDRGRFQCPATASHELGHSLGAVHDGTSNTCRSSDQYIMTPSVEDSDGKYLNMYSFSSCSINEFRSHFSQLSRRLTQQTSNSGISTVVYSSTDYNCHYVMEGKNCLKNKASEFSPSVWQTFMAQQPGQRYNITRQCTNIYGSGSFFCGNSSSVEDICRNLYCHDPKRGGCFVLKGLEAMPGTTCGDAKWCQQGLCVHDSNAPRANPQCVYGDFPGRFQVGGSSSTCQDLIQDRPFLCYHQENRQLCCDLCGKFYTGEKGCEYGDKSNFCATMEPSGCYYNEETCCRTCSSKMAGSEDCKYGDRQSWCETIKAHDCYQNEQYCCATCRTLRTNQPDCTYGDRAAWCVNVTQMGCYYNSDACCDKCKKWDIGLPGCRFGDKAEWCAPSHCANDDNKEICCQTCYTGTYPPSTTTTTTTTTSTNREESGGQEGLTTSSTNTDGITKPSSAQAKGTNVLLLSTGVLFCIFVHVF